MTGQLFGDRYQVGDTLGFGGMSEVHRGRDLRLGRDVAIKVLRADLARDPSFQARFRREAQNAASLNHPAIVAVYDTGEAAPAAEDGSRVPYIVMEYVDGETLRDLLKREGPLDPKRAMEIVADVCAALDFSHRHGIVHRDIKPANVMLTRAGAVKVMDFGIARAAADGQSSMTATSAVIGTAQYLSPEQARGESVDARSDVYSTGCVLFELLTGAPPFTGDSPVAVAYQHVREDPKAPSVTRPGLPRDLDAIVLKALNKNPLNRYQTAAEMRADLVRSLSGQAVLAPRVMDDAERTAIMGSRPTPPAARAVAPPAGTPPILAPPQRIMPDSRWEPEDEHSRAKKVWGYIGIGAIVLALLAGAILLTIRFTSTPPPTPPVAVPDLGNKTQEQAAQLLNDVRLKLGEVTKVQSGDAQKGLVVYQNPSKGTPRQPGTPVTIQIGTGITQVPIPNLTDRSEADAKAAVDKVGLQFKVQRVKSTDAQNGKVFGQDPPPGGSVKPGTVVTVQVGTGPTQIIVPDGLVGMQFDAAKKTLEGAGFGAVPRAQASTLAANQVLAVVGAKPGQKLKEGSVITLTVSDQSQFLMPDVKTLTADQAVEKMRLAGWKGDITSLDKQPFETTDFSQLDKIQEQNPEPQKPLARIGKPMVKIGTIKTFVMPHLVGEQEGNALAVLQANGYLVDTALTIELLDNDNPALTGRVVNQTIPDNMRTPINQPMTIQVLKAPPPPPPPTLITLTQSTTAQQTTAQQTTTQQTTTPTTAQTTTPTTAQTTTQQPTTPTTTQQTTTQQTTTRSSSQPPTTQSSTQPLTTQSSTQQITSSAPTTRSSSSAPPASSAGQTSGAGNGNGNGNGRGNGGGRGGG